MYALLRLEKYVPTASPDLGNNWGLSKVPRVPTAAVEHLPGSGSEAFFGSESKNKFAPYLIAILRPILKTRVSVF